MSDPELLVILSTLVTAALLIGIIITIMVASRQRAVQNAELMTARLAHESELRTIEGEVQEATLTRIASELHDNIGQILTFAVLQLEKQKIIHPEAHAVLEPIAVILDKAISNVKVLSHTLSNDFISDRGLLESINDEINRLDGIASQNVHLVTDEHEPEISKDCKIIAFRIFQEAITNALRHSRATDFFITLQGASKFMLRIADNGIGFDPGSSVRRSSGIGLTNMVRRAEIAGLKFVIESSLGEGTIVTVSGDRV